MNALRILQQNIACSEEVTEELTHLALDDEIDIVAIQEPYCVDNRVEGFHSDMFPITVFTGPECDDEPFAAIGVFSEKMKVQRVPEFCNNLCVCVRVTGEMGYLYLCSMYCPLDKSIKTLVENLRTMLKIYTDKYVMIFLDAKAKSVWWNSDKTDERGDVLEDFILSHNLCILNQKDRLHMNSDRTDYTDLTLVSSNLLDRVIEWQGMDEWTSGVNRTIGIVMNLGKDVEAPRSDPQYDGECEESTGTPVDELFDDGLDESAPIENCNVSSRSELDNRKLDASKAELNMNAETDVAEKRKLKDRYETLNTASDEEAGSETEKTPGKKSKRQKRKAGNDAGGTSDPD